MLQWGDLFTARQKVAIARACDLALTWTESVDEPYFLACCDLADSQMINVAVSMGLNRADLQR